MKRQMILILILSIVGSTAFSQTYSVMVKFGDKQWGYVNLKGERLIQQTFESCQPFSEDGIAAIYDKKNKQYFFINTKGDKLATEISEFKLITAPFGLDVETFHDGMVPVKVGDKWGYLNKEGRVAVKTKYEHVSIFDGGYAVTESGSNHYVIDRSGQETKIEVSGLADVKHFSEGLAPFKLEDKSMGYIDVHGKVAIKAQYEGLGYFENGLAWARTTDKQVGYINTKGEWVIKPQFQEAKDFDAQSGLARVKKDDHWGYVSTNGQMVNVNDTEVWGDFSEGLADGRKGDQRGFFNNKGEWIIKPQFQGVRDFKNGYAAAKQGDKWGLIDKSGSWVIKPVYDGIRDVEETK